MAGNLEPHITPNSINGIHSGLQYTGIDIIDIEAHFTPNSTHGISSSLQYICIVINIAIIIIIALVVDIVPQIPSALICLFVGYYIGTSNLFQYLFV